jgi:hypothetical protein
MGATLSSGEQRWSLCVRGCVSSPPYAITLPTSGYIYRTRNERQQLVRCMYSSALFTFHPLSCCRFMQRGRVKEPPLYKKNGRYFGGSGRGSMHRHYQRALGMGANGRSRRPNYGSRVFLLRWCEWTPLAGLMTFLAEAVDLPRRKVASG